MADKYPGNGQEGDGDHKFPVDLTAVMGQPAQKPDRRIGSNNDQRRAYGRFHG
ncbi:hypothetical protein D9M68_1001030 [compost metagenome]